MGAVDNDQPLIHPGGIHLRQIEEEVGSLVGTETVEGCLKELSALSHLAKVVLILL